MKFTDPTTRMFFFFELLTAKHRDQQSNGVPLMLLLSSAGTLKADCLSVYPLVLTHQATEFFEFITSGSSYAAKPSWLLFDEE